MFDDTAPAAPGFPGGGLGTTQTAAYTSVAAAISNGFGVGTQVVRVSATTGAYIKFGAAVF